MFQHKIAHAFLGIFEAFRYHPDLSFPSTPVCAWYDLPWADVFKAAHSLMPKHDDAVISGERSAETPRVQIITRIRYGSTVLLHHRDSEPN